MIMATVVPNPGSGVLPSDAHILPLGIATVLGGLLFGFGMVLSGGCVSGSLYRMGEGYLGSWVAIGGVLVGLYGLNRTWNWWWDNQISSDRISWLPTDLTYTGAIVVTLALFGLAFFAVSWWERRAFAGMTFTIPITSATSTGAAPGTTLSGLARRVFRDEWTPLIGGIALAAVNIMLFIRYRPIGVVGELSRWSSDFAVNFGAGSASSRALATSQAASRASSRARGSAMPSCSTQGSSQGPSRPRSWRGSSGCASRAAPGATCSRSPAA